MSQIKAKTADQRLLLVSTPKITSGNKNVDSFSVEPDSTWLYDGLTLKARFHQESGESYIVNMTKKGTEYQCDVPFEVEKQPGILFIGVYGEADGSIVKTTNEVHLTVLPGTETTGQIILSLLPQIIDIIRRTVSSTISADISEEETKTILESNLSMLRDMKFAYGQLVAYVNQYQNTDFSEDDAENIAAVCRNMWDLGVQLSAANADAAAYREALERYMANMSGQDDITLDGSTELIIDEVASELDALIAELEAARASTDALKSVYENFYIGGDNNASNT
ncbi:MAG: hypothetical protein IJU45_02310 [Clostridia bacterium]|nr:hypothetical protein [Clostridia bacterium]